MSRWAVAVALCLTTLLACSDHKAPAAKPGVASGSVTAGSDAVVARSMARVLADGLQQGANGRISSTQADCLVNEIASRVHPDALTGIAADQPDPKKLPSDVRASFGAAFDRCLSPDLAKQLRNQFGL